jgi:hypothetical protein
VRPHTLRAARVSVLIAVIVCALHERVLTAPIDAQRSTGTVTGAISDETGAPIAEAAVTLTADDGSRIEVTTGTDGRFSFSNVPAGQFQLAVAARGFAQKTISGSVATGEVANLPEIRLRVAVNAVSIDVTPSVVEIAEQQIKEQEQQRVLGVVPNFFVSFNPDAAPLNSRQKFQLSWKAHIDPIQFAFVGLVAGLQQRRGDYGGFGDGASGYAKRYAAAYATGWTRSMITQVLLPSMLRQDPRYFYKGTGSVGSRFSYAVSRSVIRKGDNGHWQPNYSGILGSLASGAISNLYYPEEDRRGARLTLENTALGIAGSALGHVAQEFLYARFTSRGHRRSAP